jgi:hypothetical protein
VWTRLRLAGLGRLHSAAEYAVPYPGWGGIGGLKDGRIDHDGPGEIAENHPLETVSGKAAPPPARRRRRRRRRLRGCIMMKTTAAVIVRTNNLRNGRASGPSAQILAAGCASF